jgi:uncharacterized protein
MAAAWAYFDTSALLKRYVDERGAIHARRLIRRYRVLSSAIAPLEAVSALCRRQRAGELKTADFEAITLRLRADWDYWELVEIGSGVLDRAEGIIRQTGVRALDALHLASASMFQTEAEAEAPFVTGDDKQRKAASSLGLRVLWVGAQR